MDDALFLQAARVGGEAHKRVGDRTMTVDVGDWLRLLEMAERAGRAVARQIAVRPDSSTPAGVAALIEASKPGRPALMLVKGGRV